MGTESFEIWTVVPASPEAIYEAWLDAVAHSAFTGEPATTEAAVGGRFTAFGDYIEGTNRELEPGRRIVQSWRTTEFSDDDPDSLLEVLLEPLDEGTRLVLRHSNVPEGQGKQYEGGWQEHYFEPLKEYFGKKKPPAKKVAPKRPVAKKAAPKKPIAKKAAPKKPVAKKKPAAAKKAAPKKKKR